MTSATSIGRPWTPEASGTSGRSIRTSPWARSDSGLHEGQECLLDWVGPTLVYCRWDTSEPAHLPFLGTVFSPTEGDTLVVEAFTLPAYRGRGIHQLASVRRLEAARVQGKARSITFVASWHAPSLRVGLVKVSGRVAGTVTLFWKLGPLRSLRVTGDVRTHSGGALARGIQARGRGPSPPGRWRS